MLHNCITRLKTVWRARNTLVTRARRIPAEIPAAIHTLALLSLGFFPPSRGTGSRAEILGRGGPAISGYYSIAPLSKIGFAARSVTFRGLPGEY